VIRIECPRFREIRPLRRARQVRRNRRRARPLTAEPERLIARRIAPPTPSRSARRRVRGQRARFIDSSGRNRADLAPRALRRTSEAQRRAPDSTEGIARFKKFGTKVPAGTKFIGRLTRADLSGGFVLLEADDAKALADFSYDWSDLMELSIVPVVEDQGLGEVFGTTHSNGKLAKSAK
jgi:hypothetical protein